MDEIRSNQIQKEFFKKTFQALQDLNSAKIPWSSCAIIKKATVMIIKQSTTLSLMVKKCLI